MNIGHLDEDQIIVSIVDEKDLPGDQKSHLEACPLCRERREGLMAQLEKVGSMAEALAPRPRGISLPEPRVSWGLSFRWPVVASSLASLVIIAAVWGLMLFPGSQVEIAQGPAEQPIVGMVSIDDILAESALPAYYQDMAPVSFEYFDDAFMDFVVPLEGADDSILENTSSKKYDIEKKEA